MEWYHYALGSLALFVLLLSWRVPRCGKWIFLLAASYLVSVLYYRSGWGIYGPPGPVMAFLCDAALFLVIREAHEEKWEMRGLGTVVAVMIALNFVMSFSVITGYPPAIPHDVYSSFLEVLNAAYLVIIGGVGLGDLIGVGDERHDLARDRRRGLSGAILDATKKARAPSHAKKMTL